MSAHFRKVITVILITGFLVNIMGACQGTATNTATSTPTLPPTPTATPLPFPKTVDILHELSITGSAVTSQQDCLQLLEGMTDGIVLGIDPQTCLVSDQSDTRASLEVYIPDEYVGQVFTLKLSWPDENSRGLRSGFPEKTAQISLDGNIIWEKSALASIENGFYYAARSEPIMLTFVPKEPGNLTIEISLPPGMSWDISSIQLFATPYPENILGIAYSPYRDCQGPSTLYQPSEQNIQADLYKLAQSSTAIRIYSSTGINAQIPQLAAQMGISVYAGAWLDDDIQSGNFEADALEMEGLANVAQTAPIDAAIIGNEYYLRHNQNGQEDINYLLSRINEFADLYPEIPVGTAEIDSLVFDWSNNGSPTIKPGYQPILDKIDILFIHIYPFWANLPVDGAAAYTVDRYMAIKSLLDDLYGGKKRVIIGEAGWPSEGWPDSNGYDGIEGNGSHNTPVFHPEAQRQYMIELLALAQEKQVDLFYFDAFDELWKIEGVDGAGRSWGYNYSDRTVKYNFSGLLLPPERLPSLVGGDVYYPYTESNFTWEVGAYPIYTEWPLEPKRKPEEISEVKPYAPAYMGDVDQIEILQCERHSHSGKTALRINYEPGGSAGWSGAYWLYPEDNWGILQAGNDMRASQKLTFWARGENGGEVVEFVTGGVCGEYDGKTLPLCPDTVQPRVSTEPIILTDAWKKYSFDLREENLSNIIGAFGFAVSQIYNPGGGAFYIDDVAFSPENPAADEQTYPKPLGSTFSIYTDYTALDNHYIPSNFMGDGEQEGFLILTQDWGDNPYLGQTAIQIKYTSGPNGWAGIYWTDPENNWGQRPGGYDLTGVTRLTFWARSERSGHRLKILIGGINCGNARFPYRDSVCSVIAPVFTLTTEWKQYSVDLTFYNRDWSRLLGGFGIVLDVPGTIYLDDITYHLDK